jgi:hypothetical protein
LSLRHAPIRRQLVHTLRLESGPGEHIQVQRLITAMHVRIQLELVEEDAVCQHPDRRTVFAWTRDERREADSLRVRQRAVIA